MEKVNTFITSGKKTLGDGLNKLFQTDNDNYVYIHVDDLVIEEQVRKELENKLHTLVGLANSIKKYGVLKPILVRKVDDQFIVVAGERRYRAAIMAGLSTVPYVLKNVGHSEAKIIQLIENIQSKGLTLYEEAEGFQELINTTGSISSALEELGKDKYWASRLLSMLRLPEHSSRLAKSSATKDMKLINEIKAIEIDNPEEAKAVVNDLIDNPGKTEARKKVAQVKLQIEKKSSSGSVFDDEPIEVILSSLYKEITLTSDGAAVLNGLRDSAREKLHAHLNDWYWKGKSENNPCKEVLKGLRKNSFGTDNYKVFKFLAFMQGMAGDDFSLSEILGDLSGS
ncbi:ParB/RepB/Spo0J family partition protein [Methyloglobulus sp.]|uniref:ParB/RepB/Spo0J family partition protein n=1 Tax=Methyloglobulus sp. TaxID=2518622 RepID=UPI0032B76361